MARAAISRSSPWSTSASSAAALSGELALPWSTPASSAAALSGELALDVGELGRGGDRRARGPRRGRSASSRSSPWPVDSDAAAAIGELDIEDELVVELKALLKRTFG
jgi:hypothetical protein